MPFAPEYLHMVYRDTTFEALLYGRASRDPKKQGHSVEDQLATGRTLCHDNNWHIVEEFKDLGLSASRHATRSRDDFEVLLDEIENEPPRPGVTRILVAFEASRYYRDLEAYVRLRNACHAAGVLLCYKGTVYDLSRSDDRRATAMDAVAAEGEADDIRDRNLRTAARTAEAGDPHGRLLFGYSRDYEVVNGQLRCVRQYENEVTGPYVVQSIIRTDQGRSVASLIRWLNSQPDAARSDGFRWNSRNIRLMLLNRAYVGERKNKGSWRAAAWPPLRGLESPAGRAMFNRVTARLTDPGRLLQRGSKPAHLLTLIALCGHCGDHAVLGQVPYSNGTCYLRCRTGRDVSIRESWLDAYVEESILAWFSDKKKATAALVKEEGNVEEKVAAVQRRINAFKEQLVEARTLAETFNEVTGRFNMSVASLASMEQRLIPKLEAAQKQMRSMTGVSPLLLSLLTSADPDVVWNGRPGSEGVEEVPALSLEQRREVVRNVVTVRLFKAARQGMRTLDPTRIRLSFVGEEGFRSRPLRAPGTGRVLPQADAPPASPGT